MRVITYLTEEEFKRLAEIATNERRTPRDQAGYILAKALANSALEEQRETHDGEIRDQA